jgi:hypothetical protein
MLRRHVISQLTMMSVCEPLKGESGLLTGIMKAMCHMRTQLVQAPGRGHASSSMLLCVFVVLQVSILGVFVLTRQESVNNVIVSAMILPH